jgi:hypothetical protein
MPPVRRGTLRCARWLGGIASLWPMVVGSPWRQGFRPSEAGRLRSTVIRTLDAIPADRPCVIEALFPSRIVAVTLAGPLKYVLEAPWICGYRSLGGCRLGFGQQRSRDEHQQNQRPTHRSLLQFAPTSQCCGKELQSTNRLLDYFIGAAVVRTSRFAAPQQFRQSDGRQSAPRSQPECRDPQSCPLRRWRRDEERPAIFAHASGAGRTRNNGEQASKRTASTAPHPAPHHPKNQRRNGRSTRRIHALAALQI